MDFIYGCIAWLGWNLLFGWTVVSWIDGNYSYALGFTVCYAIFSYINWKSGSWNFIFMPILSVVGFGVLVLIANFS